MRFTDIRRFKAWLVKQPIHKIIGYAGKICNCPFANYMVSEGFLDASVNSTFISYRSKRLKYTITVRTPRRVKHFIALVDAYSFGTAITADFALTLLKKVEEQL